MKAFCKTSAGRLCPQYTPQRLHDDDVDDHDVDDDHDDDDKKHISF